MPLMIQQNEISKLLKTTLTNPKSNTNNQLNKFKGISISLLSKTGNQLITISTTPNTEEDLDISIDQLKIYSLISYNSIISSNLSWNIIKFNKLKCIIQKIQLSDHKDQDQDKDEEDDLIYYVTLFYIDSNDIDSDSIAKLKIDSLNNVLIDGFKGYR
ncbi:uncharacterized protein KGF55_005105 [Candida pseudojiufengensis]|uniref:uncharacterized protein n=1 Tax=Candida pseudojiufengensis TaxID=497109 RepID=UPI002224CA3D|nr:uncharacterized protein KGF55_005105 [Candida pseudojiufengensis]KAI5959873.1 hypothetical protein KGF55_005105 [Candida pseudojiufengensis]